MTKPIIVLGIDGLDAQKVDDWAPGIHQDISGTMNLDDFEEPYYTDEIWPSMLLGESPRARGWCPDGNSQHEPADWESPLISLASAVSKYIIPHMIRRDLGKKLISKGFKPSSGHPAERWGESHLFEGVKSEAIEVPNWNRGELDLELSRQSWNYVIEEDGGVERFFDAVEAEIDTITERIHEVAEYPYDIIFTHYHYLDSIQHYFDQDVQREWYERTEDLVADFIEKYPNHRIVIISDHGLADYEHRPPAYVTVSNPWTEELPETPYEVRPWLSAALADSKDTNDEIEKRLQDLGYL